MLQADAVVALSAEQAGAINYVISNLSKDVVALSGAAGTGKTTLIKELAVQLLKSMPVTIAATTNKAAHVLRTKGIDAVTFHAAVMRPLFRAPLDKLGTFLEQKDLPDLTTADYPKTLLDQFDKSTLERALRTAHATGIYSAFRQLGITDVFKYIDAWLPANAQTGCLIIDESSMLGELELGIAQEVYSKIVLVGDENQLPPVKSDPVFWQVKNRVTLTEVHRQAEGSQPLIIATAIRQGKSFDVGDVEPIDSLLCRAGYPVIVWRNKTREDLTQSIREKLGYAGLPPQAGEVVICRNVSDRGAKSRGLLNNSLWRVTEADDWTISVENDQGEAIENVSVHMEELNSGHGIPFRFAYALTCHSAQGSQWNEVMIHHADAKACFGRNRDDGRKFLYTAVTRAVQHVRFVSSKVVTW